MTAQPATGPLGGQEHFEGHARGTRGVASLGNRQNGGFLAVNLYTVEPHSGFRLLTPLRPTHPSTLP